MNIYVVLYIEYAKIDNLKYLVFTREAKQHTFFKMVKLEISKSLICVHYLNQYFQNLFDLSHVMRKCWMSQQTLHKMLFITTPILCYWCCFFLVGLVPDLVITFIPLFSQLLSTLNCFTFAPIPFYYNHTILSINYNTIHCNLHHLKVRKLRSTPEQTHLETMKHGWLGVGIDLTGSLLTWDNMLHITAVLAKLIVDQSYLNIDLFPTHMRQYVAYNSSLSQADSRPVISEHWLVRYSHETICSI